MKFSAYLKIYPQYLLPHHLLSRMMHAFTRLQLTLIVRPFTRWFVHQFKVDLSIAQQPDLNAYPSFNAFFTRALKPEARPVCHGETEIASPVDGTVSQIGPIENQRIFQAKGHDYTLRELLGGSDEHAAKFINGAFATIYLSPRDYHRIHIPYDGILNEMIHIPGRLFSVNQATTELIPGLFSRNERVVCLFETDAGPMAVIMVGAIFVGSMDTVWHGTVTPTHIRRITRWHYSSKDDNRISFRRGGEIGRFNMGSTVIVLFGQDRVEWNSLVSASASIRMGECMGHKK